MIKVILLFLFLQTFSAYSQITFANSTNSKKDSVVKNQVYGFFNITNSKRFLSPNYDFLPEELGERSNERSLNTYSFGLGLKGLISRNFIWDGGIVYFQNGEQYDFKSLAGDSSFNYQSYYKYIAMPVRLNFTIGKSVKFFGGIGIVPQILVNYRQNQQWETKLGNREENSIKSKDGFSSFVASALFNLGLELQLNTGFGFFVSPEYRYQLMNTYTKTSSFIYRSYGFGVNIGITKEF
jgi:hypothetical protein